MELDTTLKINDILSSLQSHTEKVDALIELCNMYSIHQKIEELEATARAIREYGESTGNLRTRTWGILLGAFVPSYRKEFDVALAVFEEVLPVFEELNDKAGIARTLHNIARIFMLRSDYEAAREYFHKALAIEEELHNIAGISRVFRNMSMIHQQLGTYQEYIDLTVKYLPLIEASGEKAILASHLYQLSVWAMVHLSDAPTALHYAEKSLLLSQEMNDALGESQALDSIGSTYWYVGDSGRSIEYYNKSIKKGEEAGHQFELANRLTNTAYAYMLIDDYEKVLELNTRAKAIYVDADREFDSGWAEMGIGQALLGMGKAGEALEHNLKAAQLLEAEKDNHGLGYAYFRCGQALVALGRIQEAFTAYGKSLENRLFGNATLEIAEVQCERGKLLVQLGQLEEAIALLNEALADAEKINAKAQIYAIHRALSDAWEALGDDTKALYHIRLFHKYREEVQNQDSAKKAASIEYLHHRELQQKEQDATDKILNNILPHTITNRLKSGETLIADTLDPVSVLFADVVGFTPLAARLNAQDLVKLLAFIFNKFDAICLKHGLEKIKTIGDAYMAVAGAPDPCDDHALRCALAAIDMLEDFTIPNDLLHEDIKGLELDFRIGIHTGSVVAGIIGESKFAYDLWGNTVNIASRMESHGEPGKIHVSEDFKSALLVRTGRDLSVQDSVPDTESDSVPDSVSDIEQDKEIHFISRGEMDIKGKGRMETYFLTKS